MSAKYVPYIEYDSYNHIGGADNGADISAEIQDVVPRDRFQDRDRDHDIPQQRNIINELSLRDKDELFRRMVQEIDNKRQFLYQKQKYLSQIDKNSELVKVKDDYVKYHKFFVDKKQMEISAFDNLRNYLKDLVASNKLSDENIEDAAKEQSRIIDEIKSIREKINGIIRTN